MRSRPQGVFSPHLEQNPFVLDPATVKTNMVLFDLKPNGLDASELAARVEREGILLQVRGKYALRAATHYGIERAEVGRALKAISTALINK